MSLVFSALLAWLALPLAAREPAGTEASRPTKPLHLDVAKIESLATTWRMRIGDDPSWADPRLDDSAWQLVSVPIPFAERRDFELAWYRLTLRLDLGPESSRRPRPPLGVKMGRVDSAYELFAGGELIGGAGSMPPSPRLDYDRLGTYLVPQDAIGADGSLVLALRVWKSPETQGAMGGPVEGTFLFGPYEALLRQTVTAELPSLFIAGYFFILALVHFGLFARGLYDRRPQQRAYLDFGLVTLAFAGYWFLRTQWKYQLTDDFVLLKEIEYVLLYIILALFIQVLWPLLELPIGRFLRAIQITTLIGAAAMALPGLRLNVRLLPWWELLVFGVVIAFLVEVVRSALHRNAEARLVAIGTLVASASFIHDILVDYGFYLAPRLSGFGFAFFVLMLALSLANRFSRVYALVEELQVKEEESDRANRAKSEFLANMSHEIRTPMTGILGVSELLAKTPLSQKARDYVDIIHSSARSLLGIVDDILDFTKVEAGRLRLEEVGFHLPEMLQAVTELLRPRADDKGLELKLRLSEDLPAAVRGDPLRLRQVLLNLVANAVKFTATGEVRLEVSSQPVRGSSGRAVEVTFAVVDTGVGISQEVIERLFQPFSQGDTSTTRQFGGTGLGLVISQRIVERMGGLITVKSEPGRGSTFAFTLTLPISELDLASRPRFTRRALGEAGRGIRVLVAEDNPINRLVIEEQLADLGYEPILVGSGREVLAAIDREVFDLVLMDCQMPELDGYETTRRLRRQEVGSHLPIVALTAHAMEGDREKCLAAGMDDYLAKPFTQDELASTLERWI